MTAPRITKAPPAGTSAPRASRRGLKAAFLLPALAFSLTATANTGAEPLYSPTWGFSMDIPASFVYTSGDGRNRFSFVSDEGATLDIVIYPPARYAGPRACAEDVQRRLGFSEDIDEFDYHGLRAAIMPLSFAAPDAAAGWGLCVELDSPPPESGGGSGAGARPVLLALAFGARNDASLHPLYLSALDSIAPRAEDLFRPGPVAEYAWPRGEEREEAVAGTGLRARVHAGDAEAARALVQREYQILLRHAEAAYWEDAWVRFYRVIFRDAYSRLAGVAATLIASWEPGYRGSPDGNAVRAGAIPAKALAWVQTFTYERDPGGTDFVDPVSAALDGRGDCDSRALLWAVILEQADIRAAMMVSREYSHAMGLADIDGAGARIVFEGTDWLVAETTAPVAPGQIRQDAADPAKWTGVVFH